MVNKLLSFHGKQEIKDAHIRQLQMHFDADDIIQGIYWENGKGCDTGCSFHSSDHGNWPRLLGITRIIGHLRDRIFEGLPNAQAKLFPLACSNATPVGVNLDNVWRRFFIWLLVDDAEGVIKYAKNEDGRKAIQNIANAFTQSLEGDVSYEEWMKLKSAAEAAADAAYAAEAYAAAAAAYAAAAAAYAVEAYAAAAADAYTADAAAADAEAYAAADAAAAAADARRLAARNRKYIKMSEMLIQLLKEAA